jgi:cobalamin biosynthetic protein CobC
VTEHGGDPQALEGQYGRPAQGWLDLSTGINPDGYPIGVLEADDWRMLPTGAMLSALREVARAYYGVPASSAVVEASGSQALIQVLPRLRPSGIVKILGPTYGEHAPAWRAAGHRVMEVGRPADLVGDAAVAVVVNPNNPDGRVLPTRELLAMADDLARRGGCLVVDEAFADPTPEVSLASHSGRPGLVLLRSVGKFFGLAGLRLGFALTDEKTGRALAEALGPWAVSTPAARIGRQALTDAAWADAARRSLAERARRLDGLLTGAGLRVVGRTVLFRLAESPAAPQVFDRLVRAGIAVRRFAARPDRLRFGLPGAEADWRRLAAALGENR